MSAPPDRTSAALLADFPRGTSVRDIEVMCAAAKERIPTWIPPRTSKRISHAVDAHFRDDVSEPSVRRFRLVSSQPDRREPLGRDLDWNGDHFEWREVL